MDLEEHLEQLETELAQKEDDYIRLKSDLAGLRAQRDALRAELDQRTARDHVAGAPAEGDVPDLRLLKRTDAILEVLRLSDQVMTIDEVWNQLKDGNRDEPSYQPVATTLAVLVNERKVTRPARGKYQIARPSAGSAAAQGWM